jgi:hypothetical protein
MSQKEEMINSFDKQLYLLSTEPKKMYELSRGTFFQANGTDWYLETLDGMYSRCYCVFDETVFSDVQYLCNSLSVYEYVKR